MQLAVDVTEHSVYDLEFHQTGYVVSITSPIATPAVLRSSRGEHAMDIPTGTTRYCMSGSHYDLELRGCFRSAGIESVSQDHAEVILTPATYAVEGKVEGDEIAGNSDLMVVMWLWNYPQILVRAMQQNTLIDETSAVRKSGMSYDYKLVCE